MFSKCIQLILTGVLRAWLTASLILSTVLIALPTDSAEASASQVSSPPTQYQVETEQVYPPTVHQEGSVGSYPSTIDSRTSSTMSSYRSNSTQWEDIRSERGASAGMDGNQARLEVLSADEVSEVNFGLYPGTSDWMWGTATPGTNVTIVINGGTPIITYADPACNGCWEINEATEINPGDTITVTAGAGLYPVTINVPDPLTANADSSIEVVWGQIGGRSEDWVNVQGNWEDGYRETTTDTNGNFSVTYTDIPRGGDGNIHFGNDQDGTWINYNISFQTLDLILGVNYDHDWIEGNYAPGYTVTLTVKDSTNTITKATATLVTGEIPGWGGRTGFSTNNGNPWVPERPDIQPGDWVYGEVDVDGTIYEAEVQLGTITGEVDVDTDSISGTVAAPWLGTDEVDVECRSWGAPEGADNKHDTVIPNGVDSYFCEWNPDTEWDIQPGQEIAVSYRDEDGHWIYGVYHAPAPHLRIEKWLEGGGSPGEGGNASFYVQYMNQGDSIAEDVAISDSMVGMTYISDTSGVTPSGSGGNVSWSLGTVEPGDWISFYVFAEVSANAGAEISNTVEISTTNPFDMGGDWEKTSTWSGTVTANDTHLNVGKGAWTWNPAPGEDFVYSINVCNNGSTGSSPVTVTDTLPADTTFVGWWGQYAGWELISQEGQVVVLEYPSIHGWYCNEVYIRVNLDANATPGDELNNEATIAAANDMETGDNTASCTHQVGTPYTDLAIWQDWAWGSLVPGGHYRYNIRFRNEGNLPISGPIEIRATLPQGASYAGWDSWDWADIAEPDVSGNLVTWQVNGLDAGYWGTIELALDINYDTEPGTKLVNLVEIDVQDDEGNTENNFSNLEETVYAHGPNLRVKKSGEWNADGEGHNAWYHLGVENIGDQTVEDVVITDHYPSAMALDGSVNSGFWEWWEWEDHPDENYFTVTLDRLEPTWNVGINYNTIIPGTDPIELGLVFENIADVTLPLNDSNPDDNSASFALGSGPDMFMEKTLKEGEFLPGEEVTFLLRFGNAQPGHTWWWNMQGMAILTDTLPEGMSYVSANLHWCGNEEWCKFDPGIVGQTLTWENSPFGTGQWNEILLTVLISEDVQEGAELVNLAEIESNLPLVDVDPFPANNSSSYTGVVDLPFFTIYLPLVLRN